MIFTAHRVEGRALYGCSLGLLTQRTTRLDSVPSYTTFPLQFFFPVTPVTNVVLSGVRENKTTPLAIIQIIYNRHVLQRESHVYAGRAAVIFSHTSIIYMILGSSSTARCKFYNSSHQLKDMLFLIVFFIVLLYSPLKCHIFSGFVELQKQKSTP